MHEQSSHFLLVQKIMRHNTNEARDIHTLATLERALKGMGLAKLQNIIDDLERGGHLPDNPSHL